MAWLDHAMFQADMLGIKHPVHPKHLQNFYLYSEESEHWSSLPSVPAWLRSLARMERWQCFQPHLPENFQCPETEHIDTWKRNQPLGFSVWEIHVTRKFQITKFQEKRQSSKAHYLNFFFYVVLGCQILWQSSIYIYVIDFRESCSWVWIKYKISLFSFG